MPDVGPPVVDGNERDTLLASLDYLRSRVVDKLTGIDERRWREPAVASGTSLYWLGTHMAAVEINQFQRIIAGRSESDLVPPPPPPPDQDTVEHLLDRYRTACDESRLIVDQHWDINQVSAGIDRRTGSRPTVRWVLVHMIEETARHAGHLDIIREQLDGSIGR